MRTTPQTPEVIRIDEETNSTISDAEETTFIPCSDSRESDQDDEHFYVPTLKTLQMIFTTYLMDVLTVVSGS